MKRTPLKETIFMGKVTAGLAHELKNILAIIKESAGLMGDFLAMSEGRFFPHQERFSRSLIRINDQVDRGVDLATRLGLFAHATDEPVASIDLQTLRDQAAYLSHRFARSMGVTVKTEVAEKPIIVVTEPLRAQMMLFECIDLLINLESKGRHIQIVPAESSDHGISLRLVYEDDSTEKTVLLNSAAADRWSALQETALSLNVTIEFSSSPTGLLLHFARELDSQTA